MKFKTKNKVLAIIVGATMMPVVLQSNMFMTTQVCYAAERMSLDQALTELHDITMRLLNMEGLETKEDVFEYLDDNMDRIKNLTYAVLNYARISEENFNAVRQWHRDKFADLGAKDLFPIDNIIQMGLGDKQLLLNVSLDIGYDFALQECNLTCIIPDVDMLIYVLSGLGYIDNDFFYAIQYDNWEPHYMTSVRIL